MDKPLVQFYFISKQRKLLIVLVIFLIIFIIYWNTRLLPFTPFTRFWISRNYLPPAKQYKTQHSVKHKTILYWNTFFGVKEYFGRGNGIFKNCSVTSCVATADRNLLPIEQYDAIIFHGPRYSIISDGYPEKRSVHQKYIFYSLESPYNIVFDAFTKNDFYNWTMTYRKDSDIHSPYYLIEKNKTKYKVPTVEEIHNKTKKVAWFVSNCRTEGSKRRMKYALELSKWISVDIYGRCGTLTCTNGTYCYNMLEKNYKYYLSFENSICEDYVTEKLFNILKYNVVPIVLGFFNYSGIAPPNSVINTNDFRHPKDLADYLLYLDKNVDKYLQYFQWKKNYVVSKSTQYSLCQMCAALNIPLNYSSYNNIEDWFYGFKCVL